MTVQYLLFLLDSVVRSPEYHRLDADKWEALIHAATLVRFEMISRNLSDTAMVEGLYRRVLTPPKAP